MEESKQRDRGSIRQRVPDARMRGPVVSGFRNPQKASMIKPLAQEYEERWIDFRDALPIIEIYKNFRRRVRNSLSTHHIQPRDIWGSEHPDNKVVLVHRRHEWLHDYFWNEPTHQKFRVIMEDDQSSLQPGFMTAVDALLEKCDRRKWIYKRGIWQW